MAPQHRQHTDVQQGLAVVGIQREESLILGIRLVVAFLLDEQARVRRRTELSYGLSWAARIARTALRCFAHDKIEIRVCRF